MGLLRCVPAAGCLGRRARGSTGKAPQRLSEPRPEQDAALEEGQEVQHGEQERKAHEDADNDTELTELALADAPQPAEVGEPCKAVETGAVAAELEPQDAQEESPRDAGEPGAEKEQSQADAQPECEVQDDVAVLEHTDSADDGGDGPTSASGWDRIKDLVMPRGEKQAGVAVNSSHGGRSVKDMMKIFSGSGGAPSEASKASVSLHSVASDLMKHKRLEEMKDTVKSRSRNTKHTAKHYEDQIWIQANVVNTKHF